MRNVKKQFLSILALFLWLNLAFVYTASAEWEFEFTKAPIMIEKTESSVKLEWDKLDWAIWYLVSYGKASWVDTEIYENEWDEVIEWTSTEISWLDSSTKYYFSLTAIDEEANETPYSPELEVTTSMSEEEKNEVSNQLAVKDVEVIYSDKIKVIFTRDLDTSLEAVREFKIQDKDWVESEVFVKSNELTKSNELELKLESYLSTSTEYNFTIISLADFEWNLVESWVNISSTFLTSSELFPEPEAEEIVDNNEWSSEEVISNNNEWSSEEDINMNTDTSTSNKSNLVDEFWNLINPSETPEDSNQNIPSSNTESENTESFEWEIPAYADTEFVENAESTNLDDNMEENIELNSAPEMEDMTSTTAAVDWEENIELNAAWAKENMPSATAVDWEENFTNENADSSDAVDADRLPDTWAEHMLILAFAFFTAFALFRRKKSV